MLEDIGADFEAAEYESESEPGSGWSWLNPLSGHGDWTAGLLLFAALVGLLYNEVTGNQRTAAFKAMARNAVAAPTDRVDPKLEGKLVHYTGPVTAKKVARDPALGVGVTAAALYRELEMFQWYEYSERTRRRGSWFGSRSREAYDADWFSEAIDSSGFSQSQFRNPPMDLEPRVSAARDARIGPYKLDLIAVGELAMSDYYDGENVPGTLKGWPRLLENLPQPGPSLQKKRWYRLEPSVWYRGDKRTDEAEIGDLRARFYALPTGFEISVIGVQRDGEIVPYQHQRGAEPFLLADAGARSIAVMSGDWIKLGQGWQATFRLIGLVLAVISGFLFARWLTGPLMLVPGLAQLRAGTAFVGGGAGLVLGLVAIVLGWIISNLYLVFGLALLVFAGAGWYFLNHRPAPARKRQVVSSGTTTVYRPSPVPPPPPEAMPETLLPPPPPASTKPSPPPSRPRHGKLFRQVSPEELATTPLSVSRNSSLYDEPEYEEMPAVTVGTHSIPIEDLSSLRPGLATTPPIAALPAPPAPLTPPVASPSPQSPATPPAPAKPAIDLGSGALPSKPPAPVATAKAAALPRAPAASEVATPAASAPEPELVFELPPPKLSRVVLKRTGPYEVAKITRVWVDGREELLHLELRCDGELIAKGTQADIRKAIAERAPKREG